MSYPGEQGPPSRGEWWRPDPGYATPAEGSPEAPLPGADPRPDREYRGGYPPDPGEDGGTGLGRYQADGYGGLSGYGVPGRGYGGAGGDAGRYKGSGYGPGAYSGSDYNDSGYNDSGYDDSGYGPGRYDVPGYGGGERARTGYERPGGGYSAMPGSGDRVPGGGPRAVGFGYGAGGQPVPDFGDLHDGPPQAPVPAAGSRDPARGFPPRPGAGAPEYSPGQFSAWNSQPDEEGGEPGSMLAGGAARAAGAGTAFGGEGSTVALADPEDPPGWGYDHPAGAGTGTLAGEADAGAQDGAWAYAGHPVGSDQDVAGSDAWGAPDDALASPTVAPAPGGPARGGTGRTAKRRAARPPRTRRKLLIAVIVVVVLAALGGTAVYALTGRGRPMAARSAPPRAQAVKPQPTPSPTLGKWRHIATRAEDPVPLTLAELYPQTVSSKGLSYNLAIERMDTNCPHAVFGTALKTAVHKGHCTQVARASYVSGDGKVMGTIGVLNLVNYQAATKVGKVVGSNDFIGPLAAAHGPTRNIAKGTGLVQAEIKGHYLILTWAEYANLRQPSGSHDRTVLVTFSNELIQLTANRSLTNRMVTGKPGT